MSLAETAHDRAIPERNPGGAGCENRFRRVGESTGPPARLLRGDTLVALELLRRPDRGIHREFTAREGTRPDTACHSQRPWLTWREKWFTPRAKFVVVVLVVVVVGCSPLRLAGRAS